jgi:hypothetical protein
MMTGREGRGSAGRQEVILTNGGIPERQL